MALDVLAFDVISADAPPAAVPTRETPTAHGYLGIAVFDGQQWTALCRELDIASVGGSAREALDNLQDAVRLALEVARDEGLSAGSPVPEDDLRDFMLSHQRQHAISLEMFRA